MPGLTFINQLRPVTYNVDVNALAARFTTAASDETKLPDAAKRPRQIFPGEMDAKQQKSSFTYTGFIAQEVEAAAKELGFEFSGVDVPKNDKDLYGIRYAEFVVPLVKAVQELNQKVESLVRENNALKKSNAEQDNVHKIVRDQQAQIDSQQKEIDGLKAFMQEIQKQVNASKQHETK